MGSIAGGTAERDNENESVGDACLCIVKPDFTGVLLPSTVSQQALMETLYFEDEGYI